VTQGLTAQQMKILCCVRGLADLEIVASGELQEAFDARARVLGPLAFVSVGQKKDEAGEQSPLVFASADELIDDGLRNIGEIPELGFSENKGFGVVAAVAVFESHDAGLGES